VGNGTPDDRVEIAVHAAARNTQSAVQSEGDVTSESGDGHALPVPGGP
jgi:hypothetical protein